MKSVCILVPAAMREAAIEMARPLGYEAGFLRGVGPTANGTATHFGQHSWEGDALIAIVTGRVTPDIEGVTPEQIAAMVAMLDVSVSTEKEGREHWNGMLATRNLVEIAEDTGL